MAGTAGNRLTFPQPGCEQAHACPSDSRLRSSTRSPSSLEPSERRVKATSCSMHEAFPCWVSIYFLPCEEHFSALSEMKSGPTLGWIQSSVLQWLHPKLPSWGSCLARTHLLSCGCTGKHTSSITTAWPGRCNLNIRVKQNTDVAHTEATW